MAHPIKLYYFNGPALGEPIRYLLHYGGLDFVDERFGLQTFRDTLEKKVPYGKVPLLEIDGHSLYQTRPICRYLAQKLHLTGASSWDSLQCDIVADTVDDLRVYLQSFHFERHPEVRARQQRLVMDSKLPLYMDTFENRLADNGGHFVSGQLTWADFFFCAMEGYLSYMAGCAVLEGRPLLLALRERVEGLPGVREYLETRPPFPPPHPELPRILQTPPFPTEPHNSES